MGLEVLFYDAFDNLDGWGAYNPGIFSIVNQRIKAIGPGKTVSYITRTGGGIIQGATYLVEWELYDQASGGGSFYVGSNSQVNFTSYGLGWKSLYIVAGSDDSNFRMSVAGPGGSMVWIMDWLRVSLVTGKSNLINNGLINNLVNKGL